MKRLAVLGMLILLAAAVLWPWFVGGKTATDWEQGTGGVHAVDWPEGLLGYAATRVEVERSTRSHRRGWWRAEARDRVTLQSVSDPAARWSFDVISEVSHGWLGVRVDSRIETLPDALPPAGSLLALLADFGSRVQPKAETRVGLDGALTSRIALDAWSFDGASTDAPRVSMAASDVMLAVSASQQFVAAQWPELHVDRGDGAGLRMEGGQFSLRLRPDASDDGKASGDPETVWRPWKDAQAQIAIERLTLNVPPEAALMDTGRMRSEDAVSDATLAGSASSVSGSASGASASARGDRFAAGVPPADDERDRARWVYEGLELDALQATQDRRLDAHLRVTFESLATLPGREAAAAEPVAPRSLGPSGATFELRRIDRQAFAELVDEWRAGRRDPERSSGLLQAAALDVLTRSMDLQPRMALRTQVDAAPSGAMFESGLELQVRGEALVPVNPLAALQIDVDASLDPERLKSGWPGGVAGNDALPGYAALLDPLEEAVRQGWLRRDDGRYALQLAVRDQRLELNGEDRTALMLAFLFALGGGMF